jgi:hypothetical protein
MPSRLEDLFASGVLIRPATQQPNLVHLIRALASLSGAAHSDGSPPVQQLIDLIGPAEHYVFVLLDGLGMNILPMLPEQSFVRKNLKLTIHSTCPSTTCLRAHQHRHRRLAEPARRDRMVHPTCRSTSSRR